MCIYESLFPLKRVFVSLYDWKSYILYIIFLWLMCFLYIYILDGDKDIEEIREYILRSWRDNLCVYKRITMTKSFSIFLYFSIFLLNSSICNHVYSCYFLYNFADKNWWGWVAARGYGKFNVFTIYCWVRCMVELVYAKIDN